MIPLMQWIETSAIANAMNGPEWAFPAVESIHFLGFAFLIGTIAMVDLRLLGFGMRQQAGELERRLAPWTYAGVAMMLTTGPAMFTSDAVRYYFNPSFRIKMTCLALALLFNFTLHRSIARANSSGAAAKFAAFVSLLLWTGVVGAGRMIAFV